ncbi:hypothetical protein ACJMK2_026459 [Sinanodonta woodiana]|uniref:Uncharacterized protein n=1 Tax=Sinanodonta woodiana TaxID=1069815 RepID=A0ABD3XJN6_SINWO
MGVILAAAFFACILNIIRICLRTDSVSKRNIITDSNIDGGIDNMQEENLPGTYWMIVSNEMGDLSTAIETHLETPGEQLLIGPTLIPTENELGETMKPADVTLNEESDEYLSPVHAVPLELNEYIHPVHSDSVHTTTTSIHFINIL